MLEATTMVVRRGGSPGRLLRALTTALALLLVCTAAGADNRAEELFREGREEMKAGRHAEACDKFRRSHELYPGNAALLNLAICHEAIGQLAQAWKHFRASLDQLSKDDPRYAIADKHFTALDRRVAMLTVVLRAGEARPAEVRVDGRKLGDSEIGVPIVLDPGSHEILSIPKAGPVERTVVVMGEGERVTREVGLQSPVAHQPGKPGAWAGESDAAREPSHPLNASDGRRIDDPPLSGERPDSAQRTLGYAFGGGGIAALGAAGVMGVMILDRQEVVREHCPNKKSCDDEGYEAGAQGRKLVTGALVAAAVGTVAGGLGVYLIATDDAAPAGEGSARVAPKPSGNITGRLARNRSRTWQVRLNALPRMDGAGLELKGRF